MADWRDDDVLRKHSRALCRLFGGVFFCETPSAVDQKQVADYHGLPMTFESGTLTIAARARHHKYLKRYPFDVTIRASRPSGTKTELDKILEGWCRFSFYSFFDPKTPQVFPLRWVIYDLDKFRAKCANDPAWVRGWTRKANEDGSSEFVAFNILKCPELIHVMPTGELACSPHYREASTPIPRQGPSTVAVQLGPPLTTGTAPDQLGLFTRVSA